MAKRSGKQAKRSRIEGQPSWSNKSTRGDAIRETYATGRDPFPPKGAEFVRIPADAYRTLLEKAALIDDAAAAAEALAALAAGREELLSASELDELLAAPAPLAFWRRKRGLTQKELADAADTTQSHVSALERGANMSLDTARRLAAALAVDIDDLA